MSLLKKPEKIVFLTVLILSIPITVPFIGYCVEILLKAGRIIGTLIRVF